MFGLKRKENKPAADPQIRALPKSVYVPNGKDFVERLGVKQQIDSAEEMVNALCSGEREWLMNIPADEKRDPDIVIGRALRAALNLINKMEEQLSLFDRCESFDYSDLLEEPEPGYQLKVRRWGTKLPERSKWVVEKQTPEIDYALHQDGGWRNRREFRYSVCHLWFETKDDAILAMETRLKKDKELKSAVEHLISLSDL